MTLPIKRFLQTVTTAMNILFGIARQIDYRVLNRYIIAIHQNSTLDRILQEAASCLKTIINYQTVAFVIKTGEQLDVWIDPRVHEKLLEGIVRRDFGSSHPRRTHTIEQQIESGPALRAFRDQDLLSSTLLDGNIQARMYIIPERQISAYHVELINIIAKALGVALSNYEHVKRLEYSMALDPLTGCYNRRELDRLVGHHIASAKRHDRGMSLIMLDVDHFKQVNDEHGHLAGDTVLKAIADTVSASIRDGDYLARYGGEEFMVVLPDTRMPPAIELAKRLREVIENLTITLPDGRKIHKTASFGVATLRANDDQDSLFNATDTRLYQAKAAGRNRVMPDLYAVKACRVAARSQA